MEFCSHAFFGAQGYPVQAEAVACLDECCKIDDDDARLRCYDEEDIPGTNMDLWATYTQFSLWQFYNTEYPSPFREMNYEP